MTQWLKRLLKLPDFTEDVVEMHRANVLNILILSLMAALVILAGVVTPLFVQRKLFSVLLCLGVIVIMLITRRVLFSGRVRLASTLYVATWWLCLSGVILLSGGLKSFAIPCYLPVILAAGILLGPKTVLTTTFASLLVGIAAAWLEISGNLPAPYLEPSPPTALAFLVFTFIFATTPLFLGLKAQTQFQVALQNAEENYRLFFQNNPIPMWLYDLETLKFLVVNDAAIQHYGYTREEFLSMTIKDIRPPEDIPALLENVAQVAQGRLDEAGVWRHRKKDGSIIYVEITSHALTYNGRSAEIVLVNDITQRQQAEEQLFESKQFVQALIQASPLPIDVLDREGRVQVWNPAAEKLFGWSAAEALGQPVKLIPPEAEDDFQIQFNHELAGTIQTSVEVARQKKDGSLINIRLWTAPLYNTRGEIVASMGIMEDVTERRRAQKLLHEQHRFYQQIIHNVKDGILVTNKEGQFMLVNPAMAEISGYTEKELLGRIFPEIFQELQEQGIYNLFQRALAGESLTTPDHTYHNPKTQQTIWASTELVPLRNTNSEIIGLICDIHDITDRKRVEAEIVTFNQELEKRVQQRTAQLQATNQELEAFTYMVSHDLRAPLRAISGYTVAVIEDFGAQLENEGQRLLEIVVQRAEFMHQLIDGLLAFSRLGRQNLDKQPIATQNMVQRVLDNLAKEQPHRKVEVTLGKLPECQGDWMLINQVWTNLLSNAYKFTRKKEQGLIEIGARETPREITYFVRDNGVGIDMSSAQRIFGVFQRFHRADEYEGAGVGLAIVQRIIHRHGGIIWVDSQPDQGATFYFTLPVEK
jgi:PAS domain S-box-containing protein